MAEGDGKGVHAAIVAAIEKWIPFDTDGIFEVSDWRSGGVDHGVS